MSSQVELSPAVESVSLPVRVEIDPAAPGCWRLYDDAALLVLRREDGSLAAVERDYTSFPVRQDAADLRDRLNAAGPFAIPSHRQSRMAAT